MKLSTLSTLLVVLVPTLISAYPLISNSDTAKPFGTRGEDNAEILNFNAGDEAKKRGFDLDPTTAADIAETADPTGGADNTASDDKGIELLAQDGDNDTHIDDSADDPEDNGDELTNNDTDGSNDDDDNGDDDSSEKKKRGDGDDFFDDVFDALFGGDDDSDDDDNSEKKLKQRNDNNGVYQVQDFYAALGDAGNFDPETQDETLGDLADIEDSATA
ncbi:hypothetical protein G7Y89_g5085 [Cudoniella acicularis]|uniref:Uncharacterized protein n=1 Tax=Cudoniella acicularis TaxID=354080 RepID=A0A8H4RQD6_9HELO|nr:hypothetical protein G7Y89_g5085 [Cudoniella acicularis]